MAFDPPQRFLNDILVVSARKAAVRRDDQIGVCAGLIGIGLSLLLLIPGNMIIHAVADNNKINAFLPVLPAIVLILLSIGLTLLGGIIPSRKAAKSDPVTALRTE